MSAAALQEQPKENRLQELVGDAVMGIIVDLAIVHSISFLMVLGSTRRHGAWARIGLLIGSLAPFLGPVLAFTTAWAARGQS